ncbi:pentatricopeptide repeat-containing protein 1, mitochondrial [Toxorhynchites rutilus septentrionalis]|uniref:pentatricopeptide repeat-containing protein 1, mitochondrial n=1 Tax=Toxorhynchites rutilus septentrionalis TaxID=329112 RepID=UPI002479616A|nr:pentatricopeptide repeat-containing protein 1, mitochondrial [Toxorhynchites rutilus septentrionalis]
MASLILRTIRQQLLYHANISREFTDLRFTMIPRPQRFAQHLRLLHETPALLRSTVSDDVSLLEAKQDPDTFGTLSPSVPEPETPDEGDLQEEHFLQYLPARSQKLSTKQYADLIKDHLKNKRVKEAIDVLEVRMKADRVKPVNYIFNLVIGGCARAGYSKKAFQLYNKMKQHGLKVTGGTYTSLFNACANTPFLGEGMHNANRLREIMIEKGYEPNESNYNAMIKAYGRLGDLKTAFQLVDTMVVKQLCINTDTFNFLLQACISDTEFGFRHALLVWHKMYRMKSLPDIYSFNLLLRCVRDCGLGDLETTEQVIKQILQQSQTNPVELNASNTVLLEDRTQETSQELQVLHNKEHRLSQEGAPNLLSRQPHLGSLISLHDIQKPEDRLLLLGGTASFLNEMAQLKIEPDIKTMTELLDVIPSTIVAEKQILSTIRKLGIKCDIDFFNILIKKRSMRFDYDAAREVLTMIKTARLEPDIVTYGVLALGCQIPEEAHALLEEMDDAGIRTNIQILGAMLRQGTAKQNFRYVITILDIVKQNRFKPNEQFLRHLDAFNKKCESITKSYDRNPRKPGQQEFRLEYNRYKLKLDHWMDHMKLKGLDLDGAKKVVREHPWEQFKQPQMEGFEDVKNPKLRHKKKKEHSIRKINVEELDDGHQRESIRRVE